MSSCLAIWTRLCWGVPDGSGPGSGERVLCSLAAIFVGPVEILGLAERSAVHAAPVASHFQIERLANPVHHANWLVGGQGVPGIIGEVLAGLLTLDKGLLQNLDSSDRYKWRIAFRPLHGRVFHRHVLAGNLKLHHEIKTGVAVFKMRGHLVAQEVWPIAVDIGALRIPTGLCAVLNYAFRTQP